MQIGLPIAVNVLFWVWVCSVVVKAYAAHAAWQAPALGLATVMTSKLV